MKHLFLACAVLLLFSACSKTKNAVLINEATITILHNTCVKTIFKIDSPDAAVGIPWSDSTKANPVLYQHVATAGNMKNVPSTGLELLKPYKVKIYTKATGPGAVCDLLDAVNGPGISYDIEFLP